MAIEERNLAHAASETTDELETLKVWWNAHGNQVSTILVVILVVIVGIQQLNRWRDRVAVREMTQFEQAGTAEALEEILASKPNANVSALARLRLAGLYYATEKFELAQSSYEGFLAKHPQHALVDVATMGVAFCLEAQGKVKEAEAAFTAFVEAKPASFLAPMARIGQGRNRVLAKDPAGAKQVLDLVIAEKAGSVWALQADEIVQSMSRLAVPAAAPTDIASLFNMDAPASDAGPEVVDVAEEPAAPAAPVAPAEAAPVAPTEAATAAPAAPAEAEPAK